MVPGPHEDREVAEDEGAVGEGEEVPGGPVDGLSAAPKPLPGPHAAEDHLCGAPEAAGGGGDQDALLEKMVILKKIRVIIIH